MIIYKLYLKIKQYASFAAKALYHYVKHEVCLSYYYMRSNIDAAFLPFPIFTTASLLHRGAEFDEMFGSIAQALTYGFLYAYTIDVANNAEGGGLEDEINKPNRPIASKVTTATVTKTRYYISTGVWLMYSYFLGIHQWTLGWVFTVFISYPLHTARFGPAKDLSMALGTVAQLMACWEIGGSGVEVGWNWVKIISIWVFFTVSIQDFRDVPGDRACGRWTTPMLLGDAAARIYTSAALSVFAVSFFV
ncbi:hypothetical protein N7532_002187 [Penicillium argentinense]|uniref:Uncharacterized protein n=1 Tax=Penicillium argentinense TaxID=1131581 RepID=A0A9W9G5G6_9EURO|nr:uncharacterized protein N7532_002187 [Penicillium argentinense]KAJ5111652.1 hypothetical protein N7532_002187 [Penicillium argentinense]